MDLFKFKLGSEYILILRSVYAPVESNMYILIEGTQALAFDAITSEEAIALLKEKGVDTVHIFLTHEHYDHSHGVIDFQENFNTKLYCYKECKGRLSTKVGSKPRLVAYVLSVLDMKDGGNRYNEFKKSCKDYEVEADVYLDDAQVLNICGHEIKTIHVPGHTPGSVLYILDDSIVFSGDSLIEGNRIITSFRGGNKEDFQNITLPRLRALSDDLVVMPGHGNPFKKKEFDFSIYNV